MNTIYKSIAALFTGILLLTGNVAAQPAEPPMVPAPAPAMHPMEFRSTPSCYVPQTGAMVLVDSIDCAIDLLVRQEGKFTRVGRYVTDIASGRHDLVNIVRPVSVTVVGDRILLLASSAKDSSYLAVISMAAPKPAMGKDEFDSLQLIACVGFNHSSYAFQIDEPNGEILVVGKNAVGYDIDIIDINEGIEQLSADKVCDRFHYHVPKQSERIQASDPKGVGLTIVAIVVVFLLLTVVCFIMKGFASGVEKVQNRNVKKAVAANPNTVVTNTAKVPGDVYAAIAAALYCYEEDLHDEEDTILTIQKVERAWTPWNAKFYNMNHYFSTRK